MLIMVALAAGALLGDAFLHLIPEATQNLSLESIGLMVIVGMLIFFILEKIIGWRHCHEADCQEKKPPLIGVSLGASTIHNFIDGVIIGSSFALSKELGVATTIAIIMHEIPHEIGDFAVLIHGGLKKRKALFLNFLSGLASLLGVGVAVGLGENPLIENCLAAVAAGGFIYLSAADLIPELHRHRVRVKEGLYQVGAVMVGVAVMYFLL